MPLAVTCQPESNAFFHMAHAELVSEPVPEGTGAMPSEKFGIDGKPLTPNRKFARSVNIATQSVPPLFGSAGLTSIPRLVIREPLSMVPELSVIVTVILILSKSHIVAHPLCP